jgi:hypothetical protein
MRKAGGVLALSLLCIVWAGLACADTAEDAWLELVGEKDRNLVIRVGNGRLGAMPFGHHPSEKILLNEEPWPRDGSSRPHQSCLSWRQDSK